MQAEPELDEFRRLGHRIIDQLADYLSGVEERALFPAIGYLAFAPRYFRALGEQRYGMTSESALLPLLARQMALMNASATGKV